MWRRAIPGISDPMLLLLTCVAVALRNRRGGYTVPSQPASPFLGGNGAIRIHVSSIAQKVIAASLAHSSFESRPSQINVCAEKTSKLLSRTLSSRKCLPSGAVRSNLSAGRWAAMGHAGVRAAGFR